MQVQKRSGDFEDVSFDKILQRISKLCSDLTVDTIAISLSVIAGLHDKIKTTELDELTAQNAYAKEIQNVDYGTLAIRILLSNIHKNIKGTFSEAMFKLYSENRLNAEFIAFVKKHIEQLDNAIDDSRDDIFDYFGFKTMEGSYLLRSSKGELIEKPQFMWMRIAVALGRNTSIEFVLKYYKYLSKGYFIHGSPTLFNAGTVNEQLSSCFLMSVGDSIEEIAESWRRCAIISKWAGGIGLSVHQLRSTNRHIKGTNGKSSGLVPWLKIWNSIMCGVNQGGKRKGSAAIYVEIWHADIIDLLDAGRRDGNEKDRARDLFYAIWMCDAFMRAVEYDEEWYLMSEDQSPGLSNTHSTEFDNLYYKYVAEGKFLKSIPARKLLSIIIDTNMETGNPYMVFKDAANRKSNQKNLGTIKSSNLCTEIIEYTDAKEVAVCNLGSIGLPRFVKNGKFNHAKLHKVVRVLTRGLDAVIDINFYPIEAAKYSNTRHRPIGIGIQGLADVFIMMRLPFDSIEAIKLDAAIHETILHAGLTESVQLSIECGPYPSFYENDGCPASKGILQFDMWAQDVNRPAEIHFSGLYDWNELKKSIKEHGLRNSLITAPMPTATTSQILGNCECFEPYKSNLYKRRTMAGEFIIKNKYLMFDLNKLGLWTESMQNRIIAADGSIQNISEIPNDLKALYKTAFEMLPTVLIDHSAARGPFVDQSQSLNLYISREHKTRRDISKLYMYAWRRGLKSIYYMHSRAAQDAEKVTLHVPQTMLVPIKEEEDETMTCKRGGGACGS